MSEVIVFHTLDAQNRLAVPNEFWHQSPADGLSVTGILSLADTALRVRKPCILFHAGKIVPELPTGIQAVSMAGHKPGRVNTIYLDGRMRLSKYQVMHLTGVEKVDHLSKREREMMLIIFGEWLAVTNSYLWK